MSEPTTPNGADAWDVQFKAAIVVVSGSKDNALGNPSSQSFDAITRFGWLVDELITPLVLSTEKNLSDSKDECLMKVSILPNQLA